MGLMKKFRDYFLEEDYEDYEEEYEALQPEEEAPPKTAGKANVVSLQSVQKSAKVVLAEPRVYAEAQEIADHLKSRRAVIVNLQRIQHEQAKRIVDFLSGTVYAIGGDIQQVGTKIFLCTPENVDVSGSISLDGEDDRPMKRW
ncbi:cell division protein SepF [Geobacillus jurassicus]|uniref:Cell division protein SepF n=1 Tax=Geobacillus jurassicus TaxID=235932 RepID=A0ABV6GNP5_9BACL|nr:cell division protein SepF [Geobacillus jurassicus]